MSPADCSCYVYVISESVINGENLAVVVQSPTPNPLGKFTFTVEARDTSAPVTPLVYTNSDCNCCCKGSSFLIFDRTVAVAEGELPLHEIDQMPPNGIDIRRSNGNQWTITVDPSQIPNAVYREFRNGNTTTAICITSRALFNRQVEVGVPHSSTTAPQAAASSLNSDYLSLDSIREFFTTYQAVIVIVIASTLSTLISPIDQMDTFMGVYMMLFALLQFHDIHETATRLGRYDILARTHPIMGYITPGMNLLFGLWHLNGDPSVLRPIATGLFSFLKSIGPFNIMRRGEQVTCGCVGSTGSMRVGAVTFLEEALMAVLCAMQLKNMLDDGGPHDQHPQ